eukprot:scaffold4781_cov339-Prasinococcus_capsulatus_cf.AAC.22
MAARAAAARANLAPPARPLEARAGARRGRPFRGRPRAGRNFKARRRGEDARFPNPPEKDLCALCGPAHPERTWHQHPHPHPQRQRQQQQQHQQQETAPDAARGCREGRARGCGPCRRRRLRRWLARRGAAQLLVVVNAAATRGPRRCTRGRAPGRRARQSAAGGLRGRWRCCIGERSSGPAPALLWSRACAPLPRLLARRAPARGGGVDRRCARSMLAAPVPPPRPALRASPRGRRTRTRRGSRGAPLLRLTQRRPATRRQ